MSRIAGINPWISIWTKPRDTVRVLVSAKPDYGVFFLAAVFALQNFFFHAQWWSLDFKLKTIGFLLTPALGFVWLYATSSLFFYTGKLFKGKGRLDHLRTVVAWSKVPAIAGIPFAILSGSSFIEEHVRMISHTVLFLLSVWSLLILLQGLMEVQRYSLFRACLNVLSVWFAVFLFLVSLFYFFNHLIVIYF